MHGLCGGRASGNMIIRLSHLPNEAVETAKELGEYQPLVISYKTRKEVDPFPAASPLDPIDSDQPEGVDSAVEKMLQNDFDEGFMEKNHHALKEITWEHKEAF